MYVVNMCVFMRLHIYVSLLRLLFIVSVLSLHKYDLKKRVCAIKTVGETVQYPQFKYFQEVTILKSQSKNLQINHNNIQFIPVSLREI
jgi:hypothetical protein